MVWNESISPMTSVVGVDVAPPMVLDSLGAAGDVVVANIQAGYADLAAIRRLPDRLAAEAASIVALTPAGDLLPRWT